MTITKKIIAVKKKIKKCRKKLYTKQKCKQWYTNEASPKLPKLSPRLSPKVPGTNGDKGPNVTKSARHQWGQRHQRRQKCQAPMATTAPKLSPKVPGTSGDNGTNVAKSARH